MSKYEKLLSELSDSPKTWLITGVAGFIGSNLLETLLKLQQKVVGLDNFATGHRRNLAEVKSQVTEAQWSRFQFIEGDIRNLDDCREAMMFKAPLDSAGKDGSFSEIPVDYVLHQAALGSVPRSLEDPIATNDSNIVGFLNILLAARNAKVKSFVFAASSSTYGDHPGLPKVEERIGKPLSPYAVTKYVNELYADVFARCYGLKSVGLRYFNVFGPRQDPEGAYAAVIPKWTAAMIRDEPVYINGDGETSRDFCFIENVIQANILAACCEEVVEAGACQIYNVAVGGRSTLNDLFHFLREALAEEGVVYSKAPVYRAFRNGDVRHSQADISKAQNLLGYSPEFDVGAGIKRSMPWYARSLRGLFDSASR